MDLIIHLWGDGQIRSVCLHGPLYLLREGARSIGFNYTAMGSCSDSAGLFTWVVNSPKGGVARTRYVWGLVIIHMEQKSDN